MKIDVNGLKIDYWVKGKGKVVLFLHGWSKGLSKERYFELLEEVAKYRRIVAIDFPGFGESVAPKSVWEVGDYASMVESLVKKMDLGKIILVGHSFGGRVAIRMAVRRKVEIEKMVLIGSAGIERKSLKVRVLAELSKYVPKLLKNIYKVGSKDYRESEGIMREIMKKVVSENQEGELSEISCPVSLIWGREDRTTPLWQGELMKSLIKNSKLYVIEEANHGVPYRKVKEVSEILKEVL